MVLITNIKTLMVIRYYEDTFLVFLILRMELIIIVEIIISVPI